jgi:hypothetical protein
MMSRNSNLKSLIGSVSLGFLVLACGSGGSSGGFAGAGGGGDAGVGGVSGAAGRGAGGSAGASGGTTSSGGTGAQGGTQSGGAAGAAGAAGSETAGAAGAAGAAGGSGGATGGAAGTTGGVGGDTGGTGGDPGGLGGFGNFGGVGGKGGSNEFISGPSISARWAGQLDTFAVGNVGGVVYQKSYDAIGWNQGWYPLDGNITSDVDSVSWSSTRVDLVGIGTDKNVYHKVWTGGWDAWLPLTSSSDWKYSPSVAAPKADRLWVFAIGTNSHLWARYWTGSAWSAWGDRGGVFTSAPDAYAYAYTTKYGTPQENLFVVGKNTSNQISLYRQGATPSEGYPYATWLQLPTPAGGGSFDSGASICSWGNGRLDVFARMASTQHLMHTSSTNDGNYWTAWEDLGGILYSDPDCVSWGPNRIDVVVRGGGNHIYTIAYSNGAWSGWADLGVY